MEPILAFFHTELGIELVTTQAMTTRIEQSEDIQGTHTLLFSLLSLCSLFCHYQYHHYSHTNRSVSLCSLYNSTLSISTSVTAKMRAVVHSLDPFSLTAVQSMTMECKSLICALAFYYKGLDLQSLKAISRLEEEFQVEIWGVVEGGHDMDRLNNSVSLASSSLFVGLLENGVQYYSENRKLDKWKETLPEYVVLGSEVS